MDEKNVKQLTWEQTEEMVDHLVEKLGGQSFNIILCINRGGLVVGSLLSDKLALPLGVIATQSYKYGHKHQMGEQAFNPVIAATDKVQGDVLIVDELVDHFSKLSGVTSLTTACLVKKPHAEYSPDYFVEEVDAWVVFPFQKKEFENLLH